MTKVPGHVIAFIKSKQYTGLIRRAETLITTLQGEGTAHENIKE
ncbi:MAG: hypothetical protein ACE3JK_13460 [Sporolactobacillus sp.]